MAFDPPFDISVLGRVENCSGRLTLALAAKDLPRAVQIFAVHT